MKDDRQIFVEWLKHYLKMEGGLKGKDLAAVAGVSPGTLSGYITGKSKGPRTVPEREKICAAAGADYRQIILDGRVKDGQDCSPDALPRQKNDILTRRVIQEVVREELSIADSARASLPISIQDEYRKKHILEIDGFLDHEIPLEINHDLIEIQKMDEDELIEIRDMIRAKREKLERKMASGLGKPRNPAQSTGTDGKNSQGS